MTPAELAWATLQRVPDPELPALSLCDLGIVRALTPRGSGIDVVLTPTYSGCPATEVIALSVQQALAAVGFDPVHIRTRRAPAWTSDWISTDGRRKLRASGIAPPCGDAPPPGAAQAIRLVARGVDCPRCGSASTERLSAFGSTACKALHRCLDCREPFEHFKVI